MRWAGHVARMGEGRNMYRIDLFKFSDQTSHFSSLPLDVYLTIFVLIILITRNEEYRFVDIPLGYFGCVEQNFHEHDRM
jgi:hypothetical protein